MNQTIAKLDVAPSRQQKRGISGQRVFPPCPGFIPDPERACLVYNLNVPIKKQKTRPGSLFKWEAWRILLSQTYK